MFDKILKLSSITGGLLVLCGILKLIFYYDTFGINIVDFISFSEILTSFLDDVNIIIIIVLTITIQSIFIFNHTVGDLDKDDSDAKFDLMMNTIYPFRFRFFIFFAIVFTSLIALIFINVLQIRHIYIYLIIFSWLQLMTFLTLKKNKDGKIDQPNISIVISIIGALVFTLFLLAHRDIEQLEKNGVENLIILTDDSIICNKITNTMYIGKSEKYIFLFNSQSRESQIIPTSDIKRIVIKNKK